MSSMHRFRLLMLHGNETSHASFQQVTKSIFHQPRNRMRMTIKTLALAIIAAVPPASALAAEPPIQVHGLDDRHKSIRYSGAGWTAFDAGEGWNNGTAKSSMAANDFFEYANTSCTRLKWFSTKSDSRREKGDSHQI
jgi:hypothetical protein